MIPPEPVIATGKAAGFDGPVTLLAAPAFTVFVGVVAVNRFPTKPGPQPLNQIAPTFGQQIASVFTTSADRRGA